MEWKKLYEHEVTPPENVWSRIVHDLDNEYIVFKDRLSHASEAPPENVWNKIAHDLDNECIVFKDRLFHTQEAPPTDVWSKIAHDLDNECIVFKDKLFHTQEAPPSDAWHNIQAHLNNETTAKKGRTVGLPAIVRISAAAAAIAILFFTTNYFFKTKEATLNTTAQKNTQPGQKTESAGESRKDNEQATDPSAQSKEEAKSLIASNAAIVRNKKQQNNQQANVFSDGGSLPVPAIERIAADRSGITDKYDLGNGFNKRVRNLKGEIKEDISLLDLPNSYFLMTGPDGQSIRVSSKFRNTIQYLNGSGNEELLDVILRESRYWKGIFREWKEKVGNSTFIPSANNFMDIAELMHLLHQNSGK